MNGVATFTVAGPDAAAYFEMVAVHLADGQVLHGEQRYIYERTVRGLEVYFHPSSQEAGGDVRRLFHELRFVTGQDGRMRAEGSHLCREDLYLSNYVIDSRESFTVEHRVRGPRKNYVVRTSYRRE